MSRHYDDMVRIQAEVANWSQANFEEQRSKTHPQLVLNSLAPLLGLCEEFLELSTSTSQVEQEDAIGDILIYLCDYASRLDINLADLLPADSRGPYYLLADAVHTLIHATLKHHQGIRGYDDLDFYQAQLRRGIENLFQSLNYRTTGINDWMRM